MITAALWATPFLILAGACAGAWCILAGHERAACLRRSIGIHALIACTGAAVAAVYIWRTVRHPLRYARYLAARVIRRIPRRDPDGEPLDRDEMRVFTGICRGWKNPAAPERSRT